MATADLLLDAVNADLDPAPAPEPRNKPTTAAPTPGYVTAAFAPLPTITAGQHLTREHAVCLDAYRHACGLPSWLDQAPGANLTVAVNQAVNWWNMWHGKKRQRNQADAWTAAMVEEGVPIGVAERVANRCMWGHPDGLFAEENRRG